jgi:hypothetical protein
VPATRTTEEVFRDHLALRARGDVELDIERNYDPEVAMIQNGRVHRGHDGVRGCARALHADIGDAQARYDCTAGHGEIAFLEWSVDEQGVRVHDGVDTFVIRHGRIVGQTIHYDVRSGAHADHPSVDADRR